MKIFFVWITVLLLLFSEGKIEHITLHDHDFTIVTESYDIYDSKGTVAKFYREERNNDLTFLFSHTLHDATGSCADKSLEDGAYEINGSTITLYTFWDRRGRAYDSPYGARILTYTVDKSGELQKVSGKLYVETSKKSADRNSAVKYLFDPPRTEKEKEAFAQYIASAERQYKGTFLQGDEAKQLIDEVRKALRQKSRETWKSTTP